MEPSLESTSKDIRDIKLKLKEVTGEMKSVSKSQNEVQSKLDIIKRFEYFYNNELNIIKCIDLTGYQDKIDKYQDKIVEKIKCITEKNEKIV